MKGLHRVIIQNKRIRYDFTLRRNLTVLRGNSATGKTALIDMVREYINNGEASSIELTCDKPCQVVEGATWQGQLSVIRDSIVFIDEGNVFVASDEFARSIRTTDNYYVIVSRESLPNLPYSVEEVYGIRNAGKYGGFKQVYNAFYRIYGQTRLTETINPDTIITEDSNAGFQFFEGACKGITCRAAQGKANILQQARASGKGLILIVADGAAFGPQMERVMAYIGSRTNVRLFLPESFEWMILNSGLIRTSGIKEILEEPSDFIESSEYFSWERYFTRLLTDITQGSYLQYTKATINPAYLSPMAMRMILGHYKLLQLQ